MARPRRLDTNNTLTAHERDIYAIVGRQGMAGASLEFISQRLNRDGGTIRVQINAINKKLTHQVLRAVGHRWRLLDRAEAAFLSEIEQTSFTDDIEVFDHEPAEVHTYAAA